MHSSRTTVIIYSVFLALGSACLGLINGMFGPTLLDLAEIYQTDTNEASHIYTSRSVGTLVAAILETFAVNDRNSEFILISSILVQGISIALFPVVNYFWITHVASVLNGMASVFAECGSYVMLARLWKKPTLNLQIFQLTYGFATFIIPFACEPFLSKTEIVGEGKLRSAVASRIFIPYAAVGACSIVLAICMTLFSCFVSPPPNVQAENGKSEETGSRAEDNRSDGFDVFEFTLVFLVSLLLLFAFSAETTFTGMISPFVVQSELHMDKYEGAFLGGVFRATFFGGRILTVIGYKLSLNLIITLSLAFLMVSSAALSLFVLFSPLVTWLTTAGLGLGLSTLFGTAIAWTCQYLELKHWHMASVMLAVAVGTCSPVFLAAPWIDTYPMILPYVMTALSAIVCVNFGIMLLLVRGRKKITCK